MAGEKSKTPHAKPAYGAPKTCFLDRALATRPLKISAMGNEPRNLTIGRPVPDSINSTVKRRKMAVSAYRDSTHRKASS